MEKNRLVKCIFCKKKVKYFPVVYSKWGSWGNNKYACTNCTKILKEIIDENCPKPIWKKDISIIINKLSNIEKKLVKRKVAK